MNGAHESEPNTSVLFYHKSRPVLGEMHLDHPHGIFVWPAPKVIQYVFHQELMLAIFSPCSRMMVYK
jgi:hypothetical protein